MKAGSGGSRTDGGRRLVSVILDSRCGFQKIWSWEKEKKDFLCGEKSIPGILQSGLSTSIVGPAGTFIWLELGSIRRGFE